MDGSGRKRSSAFSRDSMTARGVVINIYRFIRVLLFVGVALTAVQPASGWGCKGHQIVALLAENHLTPRARAMVSDILAADPISPTLSRYCKQTGLDAFADSSTWADDERGVRPDTAPWHFIDIPRGAREGNVSKYCSPATGCVTSALAAQMRVLRDPKASAQARGDALRFVIHFVGDVHQPLHASTNNDLGGNCVPVSFFGRSPTESRPGSGIFDPNLHEVWDVEIIERFSAGESPAQVAKELDQKFQAREVAWQSAPPDFAAWAWESHQLAENTAYGKLPHRIPIETPRAVTGCAAGNNAAIDESLGADYQSTAAPVVQEQLAKAGIRLAALLNSIWQ
jgi:hypothetical protein